MVIHTSALDARSRGWVIGAVAATLVGTGVAVMVAMSGNKPEKAEKPDKSVAATVAAKPGSGTGSARDAGPVTGSAEPPTPGSDAGVVESGASPQSLAAAYHDAIGRGDGLGPLLEPDVFVVGVAANEAGDGRDAARAILAADIGATGQVDVEPLHQTIAHEGTVAWIAEELSVTPPSGGARHFTTSMIARETNGKWTIAALTWAVAVPNDIAFKLARDNQLPVPAAVADRASGAPELAAAARAAFVSRDGFVAARSKRADAFNYGSAPGERMIGGESIRRVFARMTVDMGLHDGLAVGLLGDRAGWSECNIDFTAPDKDGAQVTQTFRVMSAWLREDGGWHIVLSQFSNAKPR